MIPAFGEIADGINGLIYAARGDYVNAGLSFAAMLPFAGWAATAGKFARKADDLVTVYRGVNNTAGKGYSNALSGVAKPRGGVFGHSDPLLHNAGPNGTINSRFTSWTTDIDVGLNYAYRGGGDGVLLTLQVPKSKLVRSPNKYKITPIHNRARGAISESEWLIKGTVRGAQARVVRMGN